MAAKEAGGGFVLDGIPRNMHQARAACLIGRELQMTADVALHLQAGDAEVVRRLLTRAALEHRSDDTPEIIARRLALYRAVTSAVLAWYRDRGILVSVDAMRSAQQVGREILAALEAMRPFLALVPEQARLPVDLTGPGAGVGRHRPRRRHIRLSPSARPPGLAAAWHGGCRISAAAGPARRRRGNRPGDTPRGLTAGSPRHGQPAPAPPGRAR